MKIPVKNAKFWPAVVEMVSITLIISNKHTYLKMYIKIVYFFKTILLLYVRFSTSVGNL